MTLKGPKNNVIPMPRRPLLRDGAEPHRRRKAPTRVIAITSGKGGV
jgi:hypothetical protein